LAAAIEGQIRPVVDIALLNDAMFVRSSSRRDLNLLVGGNDSGDLQDPPLALLFDGAPQQLRDSGANTIAIDPASIPKALASFVTYGIRSAHEELFYVVDVPKLADRLASELSML
jgi:hypothetical protein